MMLVVTKAVQHQHVGALLKQLPARAINSSLPPLNGLEMA
jgi:hypothetical protein